jgi:hypothetical protein
MPAASEVESTYPSKSYAFYNLFLLWAVYVSNQWSRYILNYLYAISSDSSKYSITEACSLTSTEYGLLTGCKYMPVTLCPQKLSDY